MKVHSISKRHVLFEYRYPQWNLNLHLILGEKYDFLIDSGMGRSTVEPILAFRQQHHCSNPMMIINTHYHFDHIWGNYLFKDSLIVAHSSCVPLIQQNWESDIKQYHAFWDEEIEQCLPNLLFEKELYFAQEGIRIFHTPGHSMDGISVFDELEGVLNVGDNIGDTMQAIVPELECESSVYLQSLDKYENLPFQYLISGHNRLCDRSVINLIRARIKSE